MFKRKQTRKIKIGNMYIGGDAPISVQTMTKTKTADIDATTKQIHRCMQAGADIVRLTVNDEFAADALKDIITNCPNIPIVADIHFNHIFAVKAIEAGVSKVRINPGNIGSDDRIKQVIDKAQEFQIPIRIGVNSGSLEKDILEKYGHPTAEALYDSAMRHADIANKFGFDDLIISVKSTSVPLMIDAYRLISKNTDYPLHLGVTEAGTYKMGTLKSAIGIGTLLAEGIGDTIRVSLTDEPEREVEIGLDLLNILGFRNSKVELISCPTCGRLEVDLFKIASSVEKAIEDIKKPIKIAVMGCPVNGIGEAKEAHLGVACGKGFALLFKDGQQIKKISESEIIPELIKEIHLY